MITEAKPWDLAKDENQRQTLNAVLYRSAETLRWLCVLLHPVMPAATCEIYSQLGCATIGEALEHLNPILLKWGGLAENTQIGEVKPVFPRLDKAKIMSEISKANEPSPTNPAEVEPVPVATVAPETAPAPPMAVANETAAGEGVATFIEIGDFAKVDLRVGQVLTAERIPKADKLLLLSIDIGEEKPRQVLAGIAEYYQPEQMVDRKVVVVANLKPRKLRGYESQGMVVAASIGAEGRPVIATFTEDVPNGATVEMSDA